MQPPIFSVIGQRLISRVDDGAIELHPLIDVVHDVVGALAELKIDLGLRLLRLSKQRSENGRCKLRLSFHQIILMAAKSGAGVMIDIVFNKRHATVRAQGNK